MVEAVCRYRWLEAVGAGLLLGVSFAGAAEMTVNVTQKGGVLKKAGLGSLFGASAVAGGTSDYYLTNSLLFVAQSQGRIGENGANPYSTEAVAPVIRDSGVTMMCRFNDLLYNWLYDWSGYNFWMTQVSNATWAVTTNFPDVVYAVAPFNEPDSTMNNPEFNSDPLLQGANYDEKINWLWTQTVLAIRSINPTVKIMGPNYWQYTPWSNASHQTRMRNFLQNAIRTGTVPDIIGWHSLGPSPGDVPEALTAHYRPLEAQLNVPGRPLPVSIEEYGPGTGDFEGVPGTMVKHWAEFERYGIDFAAMGIYNNGGSLGNTLRYFWDANPLPNGGWFMMNWYKEMQGEYVPVSRWNTRYYQAFDGVASWDAAGRILTVILGGSDDQADVRIIGANTLGLGNTVRVRLDMTLWTVDEHAADLDAERHGDPQTGTFNLYDKTISFTGSDLIVPVRRVEEYNGYRIRVSPVATSDVQPTKYEAEAATVNHAVLHDGADARYLASGNAYIGGIDHADSFLTFHVIAPSQGVYQVMVRYANGMGATSTHQVIVNGQGQGEVSYEPTAGWANVEMRTVLKRVALVQGGNHITLARGVNFAEVDFIEVRPDTHRYEAEYAVWNNAVPHSYNYAFMLPTFIGQIDHEDSYVEFAVEAPATGNYRLNIAYANGTTALARHQVIVNETLQGLVPYVPSGGWLSSPDPRATRRMAPFTVSLTNGVNRIRLQWASGYAELDYVTLSTTGATVPTIPQLSIAQTAPRTVTLSWPVPALGYSLQSKPDLLASAWMNVSNRVDESDGQMKVMLSPALDDGYFRLYP